jgi:transcriptional regulator with XRE-family HTH domain
LIDVKKLKSRREALGLTQTELAKRIGITQTHYSRIEQGLRGASQETLEALLQVLGVSIGDIWESGGDDAAGEETQNIVLETGEGRSRTRCALPPTPESYAFLASQMRREGDPRLEAIVNMWEMADEAAKEKIFAVLFRPERKTRDDAEDGKGEIAN